jgi:thiamine biosynthesis lipoprotein ApbE
MEFKQTEKMLWTDIEISVIWEDAHIEHRIKIIYDFFRSFEQEFSRFLPHSSVSMLNVYSRWDVSSRFLKLIEISKKYFEATNWYFNPLMDISKIWYSKDFLEYDFKKVERESDTDFNNVVIDWNTVILKENQRIDFWWVGKW